MTDEKNKDEDRLSVKEIFHIAKETRDLEIKMFWQRTNYFLLLNSAVGGAFLYFLEQDDDKYMVILFCGIGIFVCWAWIKIGLGSKYWQAHWEQVLIELQEKTGLKEEMDIFSPKNTYKRVKKSLAMNNRFYASMVLQKPSVSGWMHGTAFFFLIVWVISLAGSVVWQFGLWQYILKCMASDLP